MEDYGHKTFEACHASAKFANPDNPAACIKMPAKKKNYKSVNNNKTEYWELVIHASKNYPYRGVVGRYSSPVQCYQELASLNRQYKYIGGTCYLRN